MRDVLYPSRAVFIGANFLSLLFSCSKLNYNHLSELPVLAQTMNISFLSV